MTPRPMAPRALVLVPTALERVRLPGLGELVAGAGSELALELIGFGPIAAAARTAALVARLAPERVVLVGIAGSFDPEVLELGSATGFEDVSIDGLGAGRGAGYLDPAALGLPQWQADDAEPVFERLPLEPVPPGMPAAPMLLTVATASGDAGHAAERAARHPGAAAEDMEGFAVALACYLTGTPLTILRGISNRVGERDKSTWRIADALSAVDRLAVSLLRP
ncbi:MAG: futalosine hydrolase [Planctomycetota bacterium]|nr:futalosine hydrolase [Planctomycetota bacterium]